MFLKTIEIQGFKSFADKVVFHFSPGVSAIVGPNGSGKSNVVDAIRWVLGEQSAKTLRGAKMEDVIFSGSVDRKPVGMARVSMILDNSQRIFAIDSDEVEVTRTLYRSGESNYMLNKNSCRLKDVQELFMDTGLGKDGFSVIGQGKIEEILTMHAEERRGLIEEAAGISKYKYRKREAERKLASTNDDMTRLDDILFELEKRIEPLSKQAEKVRVYRSLKAEEDTLQLALWTTNFVSERDILKDIEKDFESKQSGAMEAQVSLDKKEAALSEEKLALVEKRHAMEGDQAAYTEAFVATQESEKNLSLLDARHTHLDASLKSLAEQIETNRTKRQAQEENSTQLATTLEARRKEAAIVCTRAAQLRGALDDHEKALADKKAYFETLRQAQYETMSKQASLNNEKVRHEQTLSGDEARKERMASRMAALLEKEQEAKTALAHKKGEVERIEAAVEKNTLAQQERKTAHETAKTRLQNASQSYQALSQELMKMTSRLQTLEEFEASGEGYYQGVQAVLKAKKENRLSGIEGSVLQLIDIPKDYLTAIENALGGAAQNVVVQNDKDAQRAIAWLKQEKRGRVTFMPLNLVKGKRMDVSFDDEAVLGLALDLVGFSPEYEPIMAQLLGKVWIIKDLESATRLSKRTGSKYRFVTLEGDVVAPGGAMTGGHAKKQSSIVYRKHEMISLKEDIAKKEQQLEAQRVEGEILRTQVDALAQEEAQAQEVAQSQQLELREVKVVYEQLQGQCTQIEREMKLERLSQEELNEQGEDILKKIDALEQELLTLEQHLETNDQAQKETAAFIQAKEDALSEEQAQLQLVMVEKAKLEEQLSLQEQRAKEAEAETERLETERRQQIDERERLLQEFETLKIQLDETKHLRQEAQKRYETCDSAIQAAKQDIDARELALRESEKDLAGLRKTVDKLWREQNALEMKIERARGSVKRIEENLSNHFDLSPEAAIAQTDFNLDLSQAPSKIASLKDKIRHLGEINFTALEEYEEVSEKASFLSKQMNDLTQAKEKLESVIKEMEQTMASRFKETYEIVNKQFAIVFAAMFGGGSAHLELSMPGRYLETGVEIIAQPPGKKERVLTLLSGGERALTAAALLFALLEVRPSPFVILDEIEAALDEANVERFASFIKEYTDKTQFIVISHRKGTMEAASVLYGITMDANGVSKQMSVRLSDYQE